MRCVLCNRDILGFCIEVESGNHYCNDCIPTRLKTEELWTCPTCLIKTPKNMTFEALGIRYCSLNCYEKQVKETGEKMSSELKAEDFEWAKKCDKVGNLTTNGPCIKFEKEDKNFTKVKSNQGHTDYFYDDKSPTEKEDQRYSKMNTESIYQTMQQIKESQKLDKRLEIIKRLLASRDAQIELIDYLYSAGIMADADMLDSHKDLNENIVNMFKLVIEAS